jgi:hypothetical protein
MITDLEKCTFVTGIGNLHKECVQAGIRARYADVKGDGVDEKKEEKVKILFIDQGNRNMILIDREKSARELFPEISFECIFKTVETGLEELKKKNYYDFIFLDGPRVEKLQEHVENILGLDTKDFPRGVIFYGVLSLKENSYVETSFVIPLQLAGISARILLLREVVFSKFKETSGKRIEEIICS